MIENRLQTAPILVSGFLAFFSSSTKQSQNNVSFLSYVHALAKCFTALLGCGEFAPQPFCSSSYTEFYETNWQVSIVQLHLLRSRRQIPQRLRVQGWRPQPSLLESMGSGSHFQSLAGVTIWPRGHGDSDHHYHGHHYGDNYHYDHHDHH